MKANWFLWAFFLLLMLLKAASAQQTASSSAISASATTNSSMLEISTLDGTTYKSARVAKVEPDGIVINYAPNGGGIGMTKIKFENLPDDFRKRFTSSSSDTNLVFSEAAIKKFNETKTLAEKGDAEAQYNLGQCYDWGDGVPKDAFEAAKWYRKAADQGLPDAQCHLGFLYGIGAGVAKDEVESVKWIRKAAEQGNVVGQNLLALCYHDGKGVDKDEVESVKWYRKAADQGDAGSQIELGMKYFNGDGVSQDYVEAHKWLNLALAQGNGIVSDIAKENLSIVERSMTPEQIAEAQQLAREFKPRKESNSNNSISPENPTASGSGFFITEDGYLITNNHVVKGATKVRLVTREGMIDAKVVQVDAGNDLALLKASNKKFNMTAEEFLDAPDGTKIKQFELKFSTLPISASRAVKLGGTVATIGFPDPTLQGFAPKLAKGEIASLSGAADDARYFQISVPVQPGNSGGALVDERGNVVGVVSAKLNAAAALAASGALPENVNYAVKSSFLLGFLESVPAVSAKLKEPVTADRKFEEVVKSAQDAAVLVLVY